MEKEKIKDYISKAKTQEAIQQLLSDTKNVDSRKYNIVINLSNRYYTLKDKIIKNIISDNDANIDLSKINNDLLNVLDEKLGYSEMSVNSTLIFTTEGVSIKNKQANIFFNISNSFSEKILITSFDIIEYFEEETCSYSRPLARYGLELTKDSTLLGMSFIVDSKDFISFHAKINIESYSCTFKAFGIIFQFNNLNGEVMVKGSDAIYFIDDDKKFDFFKPGRFEMLLESQNPKSFMFGYVDPYPEIYFKRAKEIYRKHTGENVF